MNFGGLTNAKLEVREEEERLNFVLYLNWQIIVEASYREYLLLLHVTFNRGMLEKSEETEMAQIIAGKYLDFQEYPFEDEVHDMGDYVKNHPQVLGSDTVIICRELQVGTSSKSRRIDFLVYYPDLNQIGIVEMKNQVADEKVLLQTLRYANWIRNNPDSVRYQIKKINLDINEEEIDPESVKVVILAPKISQSLVELCQYISAFDFEFIKLQRFKDSKGEIYAITEALDIDLQESIPSKGKGEYDFNWYENEGVKPKQIEDLTDAVNGLESIIHDQDWELNTRYVKWSIRFQTYSGKNVFFINPNKTMRANFISTLERIFT